MPDNAFNYQQTSFGLFLILPTLTEVYYCVYRLEHFSSVKLREAARIFRESKISNEKSNFFLFYQNIPFCELVSKKIF